MFLLLFGMVGATVGLVSTNRLRIEAEENASVALANAEKAEHSAAARDLLAQQERVQRENAEQVNGFLIGLFQSADPTGLWHWGFREKMEAPSRLTAVEVVRRGVRQIDALKDQPEVRATMADTLGSVLCSLGDAVERLGQSWLGRPSAASPR